LFGNLPRSVDIGSNQGKAGGRLVVIRFVDGTEGLLEGCFLGCTAVFSINIEDEMNVCTLY